MARTLGIDYGEKRIGVALSDDACIAAYPHSVVANDDTVLRTIAELAASESVSSIVVGAAENPAGGNNPNEQRARHFGNALHIASGIEVIFAPEAYSSAEARRPFEPMPGERAARGPAVDAAAAAIILQTYLDKRKIK